VHLAPGRGHEREASVLGVDGAERVEVAVVDHAAVARDELVELDAVVGRKGHRVSP